MKKYLSLFLIVLLSCCFFSCASVEKLEDGRKLYYQGSIAPEELQDCSEAVIMATVNLYNGITRTVIKTTHTNIYVNIYKGKITQILVNNGNNRIDELIGPFKIDYIISAN